MGCSSSALNKGDSSRFGSGVPLDENSSTVGQNKFCVAQPKPCTPGGEAAFRGNTQGESRPPLERPKASVVPTANGLKSYHQPSLANDETPAKEATDHSRPLKKIEPLVQGGECELPQPGGKEDMLGTEDVKKDVEARTEIQSLKGNAETEPLRMAAERDSPRAGEDTKPPQAGMMNFLQTAENVLPLETAQGLPPEEAMRKDAQPQILEASPKENSSPEILEGYQFVGKVEQKELQEIPRKDMEFQLLETIPKENSSPEIAEGSQSAESSEKQQLPEAPGEAEQPQVLEIVLKENETPQMPDRSQLVPMPVTNKSLCEAPGGGRNAHESQPQVTGGNGVQPAETSETAAKVEMAREIHPDKEEQHVEGETGEKVEAEVKNEKESEEAETKEKETGEAVDLGAAGVSDKRA